MENASKAILMAGGMLIAILIVSLLIFAWDTFSNYYSRKDSIDEIEDVTEFNLQFTNYDRKNVNGYELFSLINKVIDYNMRRTTASFSDVGRENNYNYTPIKITIDINPELSKLELTTDEQWRLFKKGNTTGIYVQNNTINQLGEIVKRVNEIESDNECGGKFGGSGNLQNLTKRITKIYDVPLTGTTEEQKQQKIEIIKIVNSVTAYELPFETDTQINSSYELILNHEENVREYYEYIYFKKAKFDSDPARVQYDMNTGRITEMYFTYKP